MNFSIKKHLVTTFSLFVMAQMAHGQVLISLLFGDKLNSDKIEFGLDGGIAFSQLHGPPSSDMANALHLGFYFDFYLKERLKLHTGVIVKSTMGAKALPSYPLGDDELDQLLTNATVRRKLGYFNIPALVKYQFKNSQFYVEAGPQLGWLHKGFDEFSDSILEDDDLLYERKIKNDFKRLDFGMTAGIGYRLMKGHGMNLGIRYYLGMVDINKSMPNDHYNRSLYLSVGIPIGAGKAEKDAVKTPY
ncbi:PorT family protein [Echinicola strongylocentroti]|uniref:PorT family protein n=1 Tax=Echinicola strongylocentroti TaxID=1795355 RepID=A0A2Z4IN89_9BACT|nr:porin family protein [Echinicola strongylocentroti]AWW32108.1 PorT family protein [Echinicola strongylocentroti]